MVTGGLEVNGQCFVVECWGRVSMLLRSLEWATEPWEAEDYIIVEAGIQEAGSRVGLEVGVHYARNGQ